MRRPGARVRAAAAVGALVLLSACEPSPEEEQQSMDNQEIVDEIAAGLDRPDGGFTKIDGAYRDDASTAEEVRVSIRCDSCDALPEIDEVVREVWTSDIAPLRTIAVYVTGPEGRQSASYVVADDEDELNQRYGERP